jgi:hypothetical protein
VKAVSNNGAENVEKSWGQWATLLDASAKRDLDVVHPLVRQQARMCTSIDICDEVLEAGR